MDIGYLRSLLGRRGNEGGCDDKTPSFHLEYHGVGGAMCHVVICGGFKRIGGNKTSRSLLGFTPKTPLFVKDLFNMVSFCIALRGMDGRRKGYHLCETCLTYATFRSFLLSCVYVFTIDQGCERKTPKIMVWTGLEVSKCRARVLVSLLYHVFLPRAPSICLCWSEIGQTDAVAGDKLYTYSILVELCVSDLRRE